MKTVSVAFVIECFAFIFEVVISIFSLVYSSDSFFIVQHPFPFAIVFSLTLILSIVNLISFGFLFVDLKSLCWFSVFIISFLISYAAILFFTSPVELKTWITNWDIHWSNLSLFMQFQLEKQCCGWSNYSDRSVNDCSFKSLSGCKHLVETTIYDKYEQIFYIMILLSLNKLYVVGLVSYFYFFSSSECLFEQFEIPFLFSYDA